MSVHSPGTTPLHHYWVSVYVVSTARPPAGGKRLLVCPRSDKHIYSTNLGPTTDLVHFQTVLMKRSCLDSFLKWCFALGITLAVVEPYYIVSPMCFGSSKTNFILMRLMMIDPLPCSLSSSSFRLEQTVACLYCLDHQFFVAFIWKLFYVLLKLCCRSYLCTICFHQGHGMPSHGNLVTLDSFWCCFYGSVFSDYWGLWQLWACDRMIYTRKWKFVAVLLTFEDASLKVFRHEFQGTPFFQSFQPLLMLRWWMWYVLSRDY
jgi:hypothetical protein